MIDVKPLSILSLKLSDNVFIFTFLFFLCYFHIWCEVPDIQSENMMKILIFIHVCFNSITSFLVEKVI